MIPTAEELFESKNPQDGKLPIWAKEFAIEFAKLHCEAQAEAISKLTISHKKPVMGGRPIITELKVDKDSILNAYPLENIK